jgi:hypothetical protein
MTMTDTETTLAGEVAAAAAILRDIRALLQAAQENTQGANAPAPSHASMPGDYGTPQNPREGAVLASSGAKAPTVGTGKEESAREFRKGDRVVVSRDAKTMDGDNVYFGCETTGEITDGPDEDGDLEVTAHNSAGWLGEQWVAPKWLTPVPAEESEPEPVEWPTELGWYWVRGVDQGRPVRGVADFFDSKGRWMSFVTGDTIWEDTPGDRLDEAVPLTAVPTELLERLYAATDWESALDARHGIERWTINHEAGAR